MVSYRIVSSGGLDTQRRWISAYNDQKEWQGKKGDIHVVMPRQTDFMIESNRVNRALHCVVLRCGMSRYFPIVLFASMLLLLLKRAAGASHLACESDGRIAGTLISL